MTFLAPGFLYAAIVAAAATVALHFIASRNARAVVLPTARFVPESSVQARVRSRRFSDSRLLALRVLLVLLIGAALARPVRLPRRERIARVIVADRSGAVRSGGEVRDSVRALYRPGDAVVSFDSAAVRMPSGDSLRTPTGDVSGSLSAGLVQAYAAASRIRAGADSIELVVISPLVATEGDRATARIRALWPGRARVVRVAADTFRTGMPALVTWNAAIRPPLAIARPRVDTAGAVVAGNDVLVAPFQRRWAYPADSLRGAAVVARWVDGEPAAVERRTTTPTVASCVRSVAIPIDSTGDLLLRPAFIRLRSRLLRPCGAVATSMDTSQVTLGRVIAGDGPLARADIFPPSPSAPSSLAPWLLGAAMVLMGAELVLRRRRTGRDVE